MVIDKIGNINNIIESKKSRKISTAKKTKKNDSIQISSEAKSAADVAKTKQAVLDAPDIRTERVKAIKEQIANGTYDFNDNRILEMVADKIAQSLLR